MADTYLLPQNSTPLEKALSAQDERILDIPVRVIRDVWDPDNCPLALLPYLASAWSVDEWDPTWSEAQQRQVIRDSVWIHRHKGTIGALKRALAQIGAAASVREWFQYGGSPYTFRLSVSVAAGMTWTVAQATQLWRVALRAKNVRSYLDRMEVVQAAPSTTAMTIGIAQIARITARFVIEPARNINVPRASVYAGAAILVRSRVTVLPRTL